MIRLDAISWRFLKVWRRNLITYGKIWKVSFLTPLIEPILYILAFGMGLGVMIGEVEYGGETLSYVRFIAPALIAVAVMHNAFFETTYTSFVRMYYQRTFDGMLATPLSLEEIILAEIVWAATKAAAAAAIMLAVLGAFGYVAFPMGLLMIPAAFLGGLAFAGVGMVFTGIVPTIDLFNLPMFLFITPMFLFSGTFFPITNLPEWARPLAAAVPLHHIVELARMLCIGVHETGPLASLGYLAVFSVVFTLLGLISMRRRLIK
jgi:lipooligosaccharide transport system permease protein